MRGRISTLLALAAAAAAGPDRWGADHALFAQEVAHPWSVSDRGGGRSQSGGLVLHSSVGQTATGSAAAGQTGHAAGYLPGLRFHTGSAEILVTHEDTWNLLSVPAAADDLRKSSLFPTATSSAYAYAGAYQPRDTLGLGIGYWLKFDTAGAVMIAGGRVSEETVAVGDKWNIVGSLSSPLPVSMVAPIPPVTIASNFFGYSASTGYLAADTLLPGRGYWVKVQNAGSLVLKQGSMRSGIDDGDAYPSAGRTARDGRAASSTAGLPPPGGTPGLPSGTVRSASGRTGESFGTLVLTDNRGLRRTLFFSDSPPRGPRETAALPPPPPGGIFDARYASEAVIERPEPTGVRDVAIRISDASWPVAIRWETGGTLPGVTLVAGARTIPIDGSGTVDLDDPAGGLTLRFDRAGPGDAVPSRFALHGNYPNPFNPSTRIPFDMAERRHVQLRVYDLLGREVALLADRVVEAGSHEEVWHAVSHAGGLYFVRMTAGEYSAVRKLILLK